MLQWMRGLDTLFVILRPKLAVTNSFGCAPTRGSNIDHYFDKGDKWKSQISATHSFLKTRTVHVDREGKLSVPIRDLSQNPSINTSNSSKLRHKTRSLSSSMYCTFSIQNFTEWVIQFYKIPPCLTISSRNFCKFNSVDIELQFFTFLVVKIDNFRNVLENNSLQL